MHTQVQQQTTKVMTKLPIISGNIDQSPSRLMGSTEQSPDAVQYCDDEQQDDTPDHVRDRQHTPSEGQHREPQHVVESEQQNGLSRQ